MFRISFLQRLAIAVALMLLMVMSLPLTMLPKTAFAQGETISINPTQGPPGTNVTVIGSGWYGYNSRGIDVPIQISSPEYPPTQVADPLPDANSNFTVSFAIPANVPTGQLTISAIIGDGGSADAQFTVTSNTPTVTVQKVWTADGNNNARSSFAPADTIHYMAYINNPGSSTVTATFTFLATGPQQIYSWSGPGNVAPGTDGFYSPSTIPTNAPAGTYMVTVTVSYNGASSSGKSAFTVGSIIKQPDYAGYGAYSGNSSSGLYSDIQASWTEPTAICPPSAIPTHDAAFWVGLGGINAPLEQIATQINCLAGLVIYHAAYEMVPQNGSAIEHILGKEACRDGDSTCANKVQATVKGNDQIHAEVLYKGGGNFLLSIHDITQRWHFSITTSDNDSGTSAARSSAECIVEDPSIGLPPQPSLADFGTVFFTGCLADEQPIGNRGPFTTEFVMQTSGGTIKAMPSQLNSNYQGFSVMWQHS